MGEISMDLVGQMIKHKMLGVGTVIMHEAGMLTIAFPSKTSRFQYNEDTFKKFLSAEDPSLQEVILQEFEAEKQAAAQKKHEEKLARQREIEEKLAAASKNRARVPSPSSKATVRFERIPGKRMTFYVFQGNTFDCECQGGYIWAPICNKAGNTFHHWDRLLDVRPGDIILHGYNAHVQAVSIARGRCYECIQPEELRTENLWDQEGRRVDCDYIVLNNPVKTSNYVDDILRLCSVKYAPFDKDGNGNMGYLYELNRELAQIFLQAAVKSNPILASVDYVVELLSEVM